MKIPDRILEKEKIIKTITTTQANLPPAVLVSFIPMLPIPGANVR